MYDFAIRYDVVVPTHKRGGFGGGGNLAWPDVSKKAHLRHA